jgi:hypothetical protein
MRLSMRRPSFLGLFVRKSIELGGGGPLMPGPGGSAAADGVGPP